MAIALNIFIIHALGDAISPMIIGHISEMFNLHLAVFIAVIFLIPASIFCFMASKTLRDKKLILTYFLFWFWKYTYNIYVFSISKVN